MTPKMEWEGRTEREGLLLNEFVKVSVNEEPQIFMLNETSSK